MSEGWTRGVLRHRIVVLACWLAVLLVGGFASVRLSGLLSNVFTVPGTESDRARHVLQDAYRERPDGNFVVVFPRRTGKGGLRRQLAAAARLVPTGHASPLRAGSGAFYGEIDTALDLQHAKHYTSALRRALPGAFVTGQPAIQHDLEPILSHDLRRGEAIALPIALAILVAVFGFSVAVVVPFVFAACTITGTLAIVYALAHVLTMVSYVSNLVELVGLGLAIDYSLLIVSRFREELPSAQTVDDAVVRTMATAGRAVIFSGATVAVGLALLLFVPVPFIRSLGVGGVLVPLVSIVAAATLQPTLLSLLGRRAAQRRSRRETAFWRRLAATIMRRPVLFAVLGSAVLVSLAIPAVWLRVTPGSISALPRGPQSVTGVEALRDAFGPAALTPIEVVVDAGRNGGVDKPAVRAAVKRLTDAIFNDPEAYITASGPKPPYVDASGRYRRIEVVGRHEYGEPQSRALVERLRHTIVPRARFPAGVQVDVGGAPAQGVDYLSRTYSWFPWLAAAALALTYLLLLRAFRSVLLPLKAVVLNVLTVAAVYGMLVIVFRWGVGADLLGLYRVERIEAWIPVFLFAMLFGLSMDYEVFLVTRMRESWDEVRDNTRAVGLGLERTGRVVTAAALIMVVAFSGLVVGRIAGLQEFGVGLAFAILLDATLVRAILVPALMAIFGRWNWWLPKGGSRSSLPSSTRST